MNHENPGERVRNTLESRDVRGYNRGVDKTIASRAVGEGASIEQAGRALILASLLANMGFNFIFPLLPLYVQQISGNGPATAFWAGLVMAATPMAGAMVSPLWGRMADRLGYRPMLIRALTGTAIVTLLIALPNAPWQLVILRAGVGVLGSIQPIAMGALTSWSKPEDLSKAISRLQMAQVLGVIVGPLAGGIITATLGIRFVPVVSAAAFVMGMLVVVRWFKEPKTKRVPLRGAGVHLNPTFLWLPMVTLVAVQFTDASFNPILPLLLAQTGIDPGEVATLTGLAASFNASAAAVGAGLAGRGLRIRNRTIVIASVILAVLAIAAIRAPVPWGVVAIRIMCGGIVSGITVAAFSVGGLMVLPGQRGSAYGWLTSSTQVGYASSPLVSGAMAAIDLRAGMAVDAVLCLLAATGWKWSRGPIPAPASASKDVGSLTSS